MNEKCTERKPGFRQVAICQGLLVKDAAEFESNMMEHFGVRTQFLETIYTKPDTNQWGQPIVDTGGRADVFFAIDTDDVMKFAVPRLSMGIRWIEDALAAVNGGNRLYPERVEEYKTW